MKKLFLLFFLPIFLFGQDVIRTWDDTTLIVENVTVNGIISGIAELEFESLSQMKAFDFSQVADGARVKCNGYNTANDGFFGPDVFWIAASIATDDGLSVFDPVASGNGRLVRSFADPINVRWAGAAGDGSTDDTDSFEAAWGYASTFVNNKEDTANWTYFIKGSLYIPGGDYIYNGSGLTATAPNAASVKVFGDGISSTRIKLGSSSYMFLVTEFTPTFSCRDITFIGGLGCYRNEATLNNTSHGVEFIQCAFIDFTQCAIGWSLPIDAPFLRVRDCAFTAPASSDSIAIVVPPGGAHIIDHNWFNMGRYDIKIAAYAVLQAGTAQAGASTTITLASGASATNDQYNSRFVTITGGTGAGQVRTISDYVGSTKVATVSVAWTVTPDNTSTYEVAASQLGEAEITNNRFGRYGAQTGNRHNIWIVPSADAANAGRGLLIKGNVHGNENLQAGDMRVLIADEHASTGNDFTDKPHAVTDSPRSLYGFQIVDNTYTGNDNIDTAPLVSYCTSMGEYTWNNLIWSTQPPSIFDFRAGEPENNSRFYDVDYDVIIQNPMGFGVIPTGFSKPILNKYNYYHSRNNLSYSGGYQSEYVDVSPNRHGYTNLTEVSNSKSQITDSLGGTSASEVTYASDSNVYYAIMDSSTFSEGDLIWVELDLKKSSTNPLDEIEVHIQEDLSKKNASYRITLEDDWTRFRVPFIALQGSSAYGISFEPIGWGSGSADRFQVGLPCAYRARAPINYGHLKAQSGLWNGSHIIMGSYHLWIDSTGDFRIKFGVPTSDTDGTVVGSQS
jgi:hypothetical protein